MTWLLILVIAAVLVGILWSLASRIGRGYNVRSPGETNKGVEKPEARKR